MFSYIPLTPELFSEVIKFADEHIGKNYFSEKDLEKIYSRSKLGDQNASLIIKDADKIVGIRLSYMPGKWMDSPEVVIAPEKWKVNPEEVAYFKSLFIHPEYQAQGLGEMVSRKVMEIFKEAGAKAIVTHSWVESPNNSSVKYLTKLGFETVRDIPLAWNHIDYECVRCTPHRCTCTAREMILRLDK